MVPAPYSSLQRRVSDAVELWLERSPVEEATLILDGTGPNGALQLVVLQSLGFDRLQRLKEIHVLSGSLFSFASFLAFHMKEHLWGDGDIKRGLELLAEDWDWTNRSCHQASVLRATRYYLLKRLSRRPLFPEHALEDVMRKIITPRLAEMPLHALPCNLTVWLYDQKWGKPTAACKDSALGSCTLPQLASASAAVPGLFLPGTLHGTQYSDPVYSPAYRNLLMGLRAPGTNWLMSNVIRSKVSASEIYLCPHEYPDGRKMMARDFLAMTLNRPNPRIGAAHLAAIMPRRS